MKKKVYKMTEGDFKNIVKETVKRLVKEDTADDYVNDMWQYLEEALGAETVLNELYRYLDSDTIEGFINHMKRHYEIDES